MIDKTGMRDGDMPLLERIEAAQKRIEYGHAARRIPVEATDIDIVLSDCSREIARLRAELAERDALIQEQKEGFLRTWHVLKDHGHHPGRTDDLLHDVVLRLCLLVKDSDTEIARLNALFVAAVDVADEHRAKAEQPRTDAEWRAADRRKRINDLAARYAGHGMENVIRETGNTVEEDSLAVVKAARALATAVVEAEG